MGIRNQQKISSLGIVPGIRLALNPFAQQVGSARILRNFVPERGRLARKSFSPNFISSSSFSQGLNNPSTGEHVAGSDVDWTGPESITSSDDSRTVSSSISSGSVTDTLRAAGFGFSIPSSATIVGIEATVEKRRTAGAGNITDNLVQLVKNGVATGDDKSLIPDWDTSADEIRTYGSSTDLWGTTWTVNNINSSSFGLAFQAQVDALEGSAGTAGVDNIQIKVYYTVPVWHVKNFRYTRANAPENEILVFKANGKVYKRVPSAEQEIFPGGTSFAVLNQKPFVGQLGNRFFWNDGSAGYVYDGRNIQSWG
ncbi:hypothetical protein LCGC14_3116500, partial [marine sediment metagenome]